MAANLQYSSSRNQNLAPSTRFQGSKRKLLPWIQSTFDELDFSSAIDIMSGTGSVSYLLKRMGKQVIANDYLKFNYITAQAFIENNQYLINEIDIEWILGNNSQVEYGNFIANTFVDYYFTQSENQWIDRVICNINNYVTPANRRREQSEQSRPTH